MTTTNRNTTHFNTAAEVEAAFRAELNAFLARWGSDAKFCGAVELTGECPDCGTVPITVIIPGLYTAEGDVIRPCADFNL